MTNNPSTRLPLGFSDLIQDEAMIVSIFRSWYQQVSNRSGFEKDIKDLLHEDKLYPVLEDLFAFFRSFTHLRLVHVNEHELLSSTEEYLIAILAGSDNYNDVDNLAQKCRIYFQTAKINLRPIHQIKRSGYDLLQIKIAQSYQRFMKSPL